MRYIRPHYSTDGPRRKKRHNVQDAGLSIVVGMAIIMVYGIPESYLDECDLHLLSHEMRPEEKVTNLREVL